MLMLQWRGNIMKHQQKWTIWERPMKIIDESFALQNEDSLPNTMSYTAALKQ